MVSYTDGERYQKELQKHIALYQKLGYSLIPINYKDKKPAIEWKPYQTRKPTPEELGAWFDNSIMNIGVVCGNISGQNGTSLVVLDLDNVPDYERFKAVAEKKLGVGNLSDSTLVVRTSRGYHVYFFVIETTPSIKRPAIEIQSDGHHVLAPPSVHPGGRPYEPVNPNVTIPFTIESLRDVGIDVEQRKTVSTRGENWVSLAILGVPEGQRDATCTKLAGYFLGHGHHPEIVQTMLYSFADKCTPPLPHSQVDKVVESINKKDSTKVVPYGDSNNSLINIAPENLVVAKSEQGRNKVGTTSDGEWGRLSKTFDEIMSKTGGEWQDRSDLAEQLGTTRNDRAFRSLLQRRRESGKIRVHASRPNLIKWINTEYQVTSLDDVEETYLPINLPLGLHGLVKIPPGTVFGIAGYTSAGKTSFCLGVAELNVINQPMPVYYFYNEMGESRMRNRCTDYPLLKDAQKQGKFFPVEQKDFEIRDVIVPDAINIYDYLDRDEELYLIGRDIKELRVNIGNGVLFFAVQKPDNREFGYGGLPSAKLSNVYVAFDRIEHQDSGTLGKLSIVKCKDWVKQNPVGLYTKYLTGGKHGRLFPIIDGGWYRGNMKVFSQEGE